MQPQGFYIMKIKLGFVTNSSSTVYILYIPPGYDMTDKELDEAVEKYFYEVEENFEGDNEYRKQVYVDFIDLKENGYLHMEDSYYTLPAVREILVNMNHFDIFQIDVGPDSEQMHNVTEEKIKEIIATQELIRIREEKSVTKITKQ